MYFTGDEPHYLLSVLSFVNDRDFNLLNNYANRDWKVIGYPLELKPQGSPPHKPGLIPSEHGTAFPLMLAPIFAMAGVNGVRYWLIAVSVFACVLCSAVLDELRVDRIVGTIAGSILAFAPTWQLLASRVYPETTAAVCFLAAALLLARRERSSGVPWPRIEAATAGLLIGLPPILYLKYSPLAAGIGLLALAIPAVRKSPAFWSGLAVAMFLGIWNIAVFGEQGALGGVFTGPEFFKIPGSFYRFWYMFFDRFHGIFIFEPILALALWAIPYYLLRVKEQNGLVLAGLALALSFYFGMYGLWLAGPAYSVPGRYPAAGVPIMAILCASWLMRPDSLRPLRLVIAAILGTVSIVFYAASFIQNTRLDLSLYDYRSHFPRFWISWEEKDIIGLWLKSGVGYWMVFAILATKAGAYMWRLRREPPSPSFPATRNIKNVRSAHP